MYELAISLRYLKSRRRHTFVSLIGLVSVGGVAVGVMVLIIVVAVMSGFEQSLKEKILGINSHIWILPQATQYVEGYRDIVERVSARTKRYFREVWEKMRQECLQEVDPDEGFSDTWY